MSSSTRRRPKSGKCRRTERELKLPKEQRGGNCGLLSGRLPDPRENKKPIFNSGDAEVHGCAAFNPVKAVYAVWAGRGSMHGVHAANKR